MLRETPCHKSPLCYTMSPISTNGMLKGQLYRCCIKIIPKVLYTNTELGNANGVWVKQRITLFYLCMVYDMLFDTLR